jgi:hypothetical protein
MDGVVTRFSELGPHQADEAGACSDVAPTAAAPRLDAPLRMIVRCPQLPATKTDSLA